MAFALSVVVPLLFAAFASSVAIAPANCVVCAFGSGSIETAASLRALVAPQLHR